MSGRLGYSPLNGHLKRINCSQAGVAVGEESGGMEDGAAAQEIQQAHLPLVLILFNSFITNLIIEKSTNSTHTYTKWPALPKIGLAVKVVWMLRSRVAILLLHLNSK